MISPELIREWSPLYKNLHTVPLAVMSLLAPIEAMYHSLFFSLVNACGIMIGQRLGVERLEDVPHLGGALLGHR